MYFFQIMPTSAKSHNEMQKSVCFVCFLKPKTLRNITPRLESMLNNATSISYSSEEWSWLPTVICGGCCLALDKVSKNPKHTFKMIDYFSLIPPKPKHSMETRSSENETSVQCGCSVCSVGRFQGGQYNHHRVNVSEPPGRPRLTGESVSAPVQVCSLCHGQFGRGIKHQCGRASKRDNLEDLLRNTSEKSKERVISSQLKEVFVAKGATTKGGTVTLATGGTPVQATLGKLHQKPDIKFSQEALNKLQSSIGASDRKMNIVANFLRGECGRASVVKIQEEMMERNKKLSRHFESKILKQKKYVTEDGDNENADSKKKKKKVAVEVEKPVVVVKSVEDFATHVMLERNLSPENCEIQIGIDDGQQLLKIMMTIKEKDKPEIENKKTRYVEGFRPQDFKLSGVKKLFILFASPTCERHDNLETILQDLDLQALEFGFSCDLKLVLILCGKQCASSKHCCPFCTGSAPWVAKGSSNTIGSLWSDYRTYVLGGSNLKKAMKFNNVVNPPLLTGPDDSLVLSIIYFPELHVLIGVVGKLVKEFEKNVFSTPEEGKQFIDTWMASPTVNVCKTVYHGSANFVGDMAKKLLKKLDNLRMEVNKLEPEIVEKATPYIDTLEKLEAVRMCCFGQLVVEGYTNKIKEFSTAYRRLDISIPLKVKDSIQ